MQFIEEEPSLPIFGSRCFGPSLDHQPSTKHAAGYSQCTQQVGACSKHVSNFLTCRLVVLESRERPCFHLPLGYQILVVNFAIINIVTVG